MDSNYLSDDEEYTTNVDEQVDAYGNIKIEYDRDYVDYDSNDEINEDELDEEELKEYREYQEYKQKQNELIRNNISSKEVLDFEEKNTIKKNKKVKEPKKNTNMNFVEFNNYIDKVNEDKKPKKFVSKRLLGKKGLSEEQNTTIPEIKKNVSHTRQFKPKLPPYFHVYKN